MLALSSLVSIDSAKTLTPASPFSPALALPEFVSAYLATCKETSSLSLELACLPPFVLK